ncbi:MAG: hypothetical protein RIQ78_572 [Bacteroidota bacterium]|jgi:lipopolysaccharide transport system ATP-binding protein
MSSTASIELDNVFINFPVFNAINMSLKNRFLTAASGGILNRQKDGLVVVSSLQNITLHIAQGERVGLVGHNGAGKTTLLRVLSGIYHPTMGEIRIKGAITSLINISLGIDAEATGRENIRLRAVMMGQKPSESKKKVDEIIEFSGLGDFIDMPVRTYSSGMQLRLAFAVSTSIRPQILIMDEWLSTGDKDFKERAEARLKEVVRSTEILILASHSKELLLKTCNRIVWLERGEIKMDGEAEAVANAYFK